MLGFSSSAIKVSAAASWISSSKSSPDADRARGKLAAASSPGMCLSFPQANRHSRGSLGGFHVQRDQRGARRNSRKPGFNRSVEKFAASDRAATFCNGHFAILHAKLLKHAGN